MSYRIDQDFEYAGKDYWRWRAWIVADAAEMAQVEQVVWILHPSFKRTRIAVTKPAHGFRLAAAGWGTFRLKAEVVLKSAQVVSLARNLKLEYPDKGADEGQRGSSNTGDYSTEQTQALQPSAGQRAQAGPSPARRNVFLSYSAEDSRAATRLRDQLQAAGATVRDASSVKMGESWTEAVRHMLALSDTVVGLVTEAEVSPFVLDELKAALAAGKPTLALVPVGSGLASESINLSNTDLHAGGENSAVSVLPAQVVRIEFDPARGDPAMLLSHIDALASEA